MTAPPDIAALRTVVLVGAQGAGKTTLAAALTHDSSGAAEHAPTLQLVPLDVPAGRVRVTLIDTPGNPTFATWVHAGMRAADAALFIVAAGSTVSPMVQRHWRAWTEEGRPAAVVVTKLDLPEADFDETVAQCERFFGESVVPLSLPLFSGEAGAPGPPAGILDLLTTTMDVSRGRSAVVEPPDAEHVALIGEARGRLIEAVAAVSDDESLLDRYLDGEALDVSTLHRELRHAVTAGLVHPLLPAVGRSGVGCAALLAFLVDNFPSPLTRTAPVGVHADGSPRPPLAADPDGPLVAEVVRRLPNRAALVRIYSGTLAASEPVTVDGASRSVVLPLADRALAGELVVVDGLGGVPVGTTLTAEGTRRDVEPAHAGLPFAIVLDGPADQERETALRELLTEDPAVRHEPHAPRDVDVLWCLGSEHARWIAGRLSELAGRPVTYRAAFESPRHRAALTVAVPTALTGAVLKQVSALGALDTARVEDGDDTVFTCAVPEPSLVTVIDAIRACSDGTAHIAVAIDREA